METHTVSHTRTRLQGDAQVNHILDTTLQRESKLSSTQNKLRTTSVAEKTFREVMDMNHLLEEAPINTGVRTEFINTVQTGVKKSVRLQDQTQLTEHVKKLTLQGNTLALGAAEEEDVIWKSYMFSLKAGTLKFLLNASIDTLPTAVNLKRWKKSPSDMCKLCRGRQTTNHILNCCSVALNTKRFTWRHDTLLKYIVSSVDTEKFRVFSDIQGHQAAGGGSIPPEICVTNLRPDIVVINVENNTVNLLELTCPSEQNIDIRHKQKSLKYDHFLGDIPQSTLTCLKISSKGYISPRNHTSLNFIHKFLKKNIKLTTFKKNILLLNIYTSYHIWLCRSDPAFIVPPLLSPPFLDQVAPTGRGPGQ